MIIEHLMSNDVYLPWWTALQRNTLSRTSTVIPSVRILAVTVNFGVLSEVKMLASFLRCFPNIDTLHIKVAANSFSQSIICQYHDPYM